MIESKQTEPREHLKEFPGLGSPIIEEIGDFRLIEQKLFGYHDEDAEFEKFNAKLKEDCRIKNCEYHFQTKTTFDNSLFQYMLFFLIVPLDQ